MKQKFFFGFHFLRFIYFNLIISNYRREKYINKNPEVISFGVKLLLISKRYPSAGIHRTDGTLAD